MNRVVLKLNEHGEVDLVFSDEKIEVYWVEQMGKEPSVYLYDATRFGEQLVDQEICSHPIKHMNDDIHGPLKALPKFQSQPKS